MTARQSLSGFVRSNYGADPIYNWDPTRSGTGGGVGGSQYLLGTMQELANTHPGFFNTNGNLVRDPTTGRITLAHGTNSTYDPLLGLNPTDKVLGFEDVPMSGIEAAVGGLQGQFLNPNFSPLAAPLYQQSLEVKKQLDALLAQVNALPNTNAGGVREQRQSLYNQIGPLSQQYSDLVAQYSGNSINGVQKLLSLAQLQADPSMKDYNDLLFKLDISQYAPPAPITKADPRAVMSQFFNTAPYQLAFGSNQDTLDPNLDPTQRFQADPGYQFVQDEGLRQLQFDQAKKGLLESGAGARDNRQFAEGLADQNYQRYQQQVQGLFTNGQNGIAGVMNQGAQASGQIGQNNQQLAQLLASLTGQQGSNMGNLTGQTGTNIANLFGQQGTFGGSLFANTGAAQSSNVMSAASLNAQIQAAQIAAEAQKSAAETGAMGQMAGSAMSLLGSFL